MILEENIQKKLFRKENKSATKSKMGKEKAKRDTDSLEEQLSGKIHI